MKRYIDWGKAIERLNASPAFTNMGTDGLFLLGVVEDLLKKQPTADVVPMSEVAREIFEEIEDFMIDSTIYKMPAKLMLSSKLAELKKKHTDKKECTCCKHFVGCEKAVWIGFCEEYEDKQ